jgi:hypothetical protein
MPHALPTASSLFWSSQYLMKSTHYEAPSTVIPKYFKFAIFSKDLLAMIMLWLCPTLWCHL